MDVRPWINFLNDDIMICSVIESKLDVASSYTKMYGFLSMVLAMATLCFSPPLSLRPLSPTIVSYFIGIFSMVLCRSHISATL
ncbi:hypothetical protein BpHYR1_020327 [Brachionus plicatilis]|uniref:Uncharacterized protein n=1 Tax=Brachionus plicatilis TaxID=10195 RepID=A0A3M7Q889_BRAPC|nr:hypothetical protein BpHYR1_020327 [Brachionus plicatilis]